MNDMKLAHFRQALAGHRDALVEWMHADAPHKDVHLGGREIKEVIQIVSQIKESLEQIDNGRFGVCRQCQGQVETERLEMDYTTQVCLDHFTSQQIQALEADLELAARVQKELLPCCVPVQSGMEIAAHTLSARIVSGDYYDFFLTKNGAQGLALADVMGKGLPASMLMSNLQASLRILGPQHEELHLLADRLNQLFRFNLKLIKFISLFLAAIDRNAGILRYCNAGHHPGIYYNAVSKSIQWLEPTGPAIGLTKSAEFTSAKINFRDGDVFVFYTDGLVEARNSQQEEFGENRLHDFVKNHAHKAAANMMTALQETLKDFTASFHDDVTILAVKIV